MDGSGINYERFFDLSPDLLCIAGFDGYFKRINPAVSKLLEYSEEELYSRPIDDFVHPEDRQITISSRRSVIKSKTLHHFENRYVTKSGKIVWLAWTSRPVNSEKLVFAIAKNITHIKKLEAERLALLENLTRGNNELKQLSLTTSHDLRSPLSSLLSVFDLLDLSRIEDRDTVELIEILKLTGENLKQTLNNYVDVLSEKLSEQAVAEEVNLEESLEDVLQTIQSLIKTTRTTIQTDFSEFNRVEFNKSYMESVFLNLITNAIKYSRPEVPPVINIQSEVKNGSQRLTVTDNGRGIDLGVVKEKIFGMHQTFHGHQDSKGIGLYLVYNHITSFGGDIQVESEINKGTRFIITFSH